LCFAACDFSHRYPVLASTPHPLFHGFTHAKWPRKSLFDSRMLAKASPTVGPLHLSPFWRARLFPPVLTAPARLPDHVVRLTNRRALLLEGLLRASGLAKHCVRLTFLATALSPCRSRRYCLRSRTLARRETFGTLLLCLSFLPHSCLHRVLDSFSSSKPGLGGSTRMKRSKFQRAFIHVPPQNPLVCFARLAVPLGGDYFFCPTALSAPFPFCFPGNTAITFSRHSTMVRGRLSPPLVIHGHFSLYQPITSILLRIMTSGPAPVAGPFCSFFCGPGHGPS